MRLLSILFLGLVVPGLLSGQELVTDTVVTMKARVIEVVSQDIRHEDGLGVQSLHQTIRATVLDGPEVGKDITVENDFLNLKQGDVFYLQHTTSELDGSDYYNVYERARSVPLAVLFAIFVAVVAIFGGKQGVRGLLALVGSFIFIGAMLLPGIIAGYSPILVSIAVASLIIVLGSYVTHGFTKTTSAAVVGMIITICITGLLAWLSIEWTYLQGWSSDEVTYLHLNSHGTIDLAGLLLGGILIGLLGVLYDGAIGQAVSVEELASAGKHLTRGEIYQRALRIGREHVGALVNTLAIAYAGAALPLLLLFYQVGGIDIGLTINREIFATELVRMLVGSIGLVLAVPITTAVAVRMLVNDRATIE
jgi:uncharacterized membrane protein